MIEAKTRRPTVQPKFASIIGAAALAIALSACGDDSSDDATTAAEPDTEAPDTEAPDPADVVQTASTDLGDVLVDADGLTLYGFTQDTNGIPTCDDDCAAAWPPLTVGSDELPSGLDPNVFAVVERSDGTFQLSAGNQPLYRFSGDSAPGDVNGQGVADVWFAVSPEGELIGADGDGADNTDTGTDTGGGY
jgi:predicted lipoprotein with Yx(FWY)xxD motif